MFVVLTAACGATRPAVSVWVLEASTNRTADEAASKDGDRDSHGDGRSTGNKTRTERVKLEGAINETLSFVFAIRPDREPIPRPDLRVKPLTSVGARIDASAITVYRMQGVPIQRFPGWHIRTVPTYRRDDCPLDVLVPIHAPRGGIPATLAAGETYHFWVDVAIPKGTFTGTYTGEIEWLAGDRTACAVDIELTVWPLILPDESDIPFVAEVDHRALFHHHVPTYTPQPGTGSDDWRDHPHRDELDGLLQSTLRELHAHRLAPVLPQLSPPVKVGASGELVVDWEAYDAVVEPLLNGRAFFNRVPLPLWPAPLSNVLGAVSMGSGLSSPGSASLLGQYVSQCARHFEEEGWLDRSYALAPPMPPPTAEMVETTRRFASIVRTANPRIRVVSRLFPQDLRPYGWVDFPHTYFSESVDVWMPPAQFFDRKMLAAERDAGRRTWIAVDRPPFSGSTAIYAAPSDVRVLTWQAETLGAQAAFLGCVNAWPPAADDAEDCVRVDPNTLLYPGRPYGLQEPVASVRLKHLRRSLQDAAYVRLLKEHGLDHVAGTLRQSLCGYAGSDAYRTHFADGRPNGWLGDPELYEAARRIMAEELMTTVYAEPVDHRTERFARSATWRRFMLAARRTDLHVDGARVRIQGPPARREAEVECALTVVNQTRVPVSGTVRWDALPEAWSALDGERSFQALSPGDARRLRLSATTRTLPAGGGGVWGMPIELRIDEGASPRHIARVAYLTAVPLHGPIRVDGDLSDWPAGSANVASDFRLVAGRPGAAGEGDVTEPVARTLGFVMRDGDDLYVAVNCETDPRAVWPTARRKGVHYDDLIPIDDEDLVELLIDPLNMGTRSPADLFHIVVKRSGTDVTEKGIGLQPPCGLREPWPVDLEVATGVAPDRWTAELRIPLASIRSDLTQDVVWGFNITRYDAVHQEFSTWSGATGNAYDPMSLGNLYLP